MRVRKIKTADDAKAYIGNSKSWRRGWYATRQKYQISKIYGEDFYVGKDGSHACGFCFVACNHRKVNYNPACEYCPEIINQICGKRTGYTDQELLDILDSIKDEIFALK